MNGDLLTVREPKIDLYNIGFEGVCQLGRAKDGEHLSALVERIAEPTVIAIDAPWGAGKSVFLKCWVGAHTLENDGRAKTVYFDAFRHDFMDDPLIGLTGAISERIENKGSDGRKWQKAREAASKLVRPAFRTGVAIITAGATEISGAVVDAALEAGSKELKEASKEFWKKEDGKRAAMQSFREALQTLAADQKLVIVVDELDRCRPDYALSLLEVIKHFFDVHNVHFVLGVNLKELANSVRARYGAGVEGEKYLQKFITVSMPLRPKRSHITHGQTQIQHFRNVCKEIGFSDDWKCEWIEEYLKCIDLHAGLSLRDVEKIATLAIVTPPPRRGQDKELHLYIGLLILQVLSPKAVERARRGILTDEDVFSILRLRRRPNQNTFEHSAHIFWRLVANQNSSSRPEYLNEAAKEHFENNDPKEFLREVITETLDVFQILS